ncbi:MAG: amidase [Chromatiales bacterium]|nr:amidase [Chromatiales bacterium]
MGRRTYELASKTATELSMLIAAGEVSPVDVISDALAAAEAIGPTLNCFITVCAERACEEAQAAEKRLANGGQARPLEGIPFTAKDLIDTGGVRTTFGSLIHEHRVPDADAVAVARLREAGAILVAKTTTPEFGHKAFTDAPLFGRTRNAWHSERTCGGSSGGAAAATAAGITPLALATDGGGSTRIPAACNGVVGLKQSAGAIAHSQTPDPFGNYTYVTPTTRTVADTQMMLAVMRGAHPTDPWSYVAPADDPATDQWQTELPLKGIRIGITPHLGNDTLSTSMLGALHQAARLLEGRGACVAPLEETLAPIEPLWRVINHATWRTRFEDLVAKHGDIMTPTLVRQVEMAESFTAVDFQRSSFERGALFRRAQTWFERFDVLLMPTLARTALPIDQNLFDPVQIDNELLPEVRSAWFPYTMPFNLTGHPAVTLPSGLDPDGLPLSIQLIGGFQADDMLLRIAAVYEEDAEWNGRIAPIDATDSA